MPPQIRIASPCSADWNRMQGDDRKRFCNACQLNVYDLSAMTPAEVEKLLIDANGQHLCGRFYARPDGTMLTQDCPVGFHARVARVSRWAGAALTAMMSVSFAVAQEADPASTTSAHRPEQTEAVFTVTDQSGAVIQRATIVIVDSKSREVTTGQTDDLGTYRAMLTTGAHVATVRVQGFATLRQPFTNSLGTTTQLTLTPAIAVMGEIFYSEMASPVVDESQVPGFLPTSTRERANPIPPTSAPRKSPFQRLIHRLGF